MFTISVDAEDENHVHECYTFKLSYAEGAVPSLVVRDNKRGTSTNKLPLDAAKRSMSQLFRQLIIMTQSLSPLPEHSDRVLSIRLFFTESAPEDYQPPGFRAAQSSDAAKFVTSGTSDRPHDQEIGSFNAGYHACTLHITTIDEFDQSQSQAERKVWDAEHQAKLACVTRQPEHVFKPTAFEVSAPFELKASQTDTQTQEIATSQMTQIMTQQDPADLPDEFSIESRRSARLKSSQVAATESHRDCPNSQQDVQMIDQVSEVIYCECGDHQEDGLMMQCERCQRWSHSVCYGFRGGLPDGYLHTCFACTEPALEHLERFKSLAIMRRALYILWEDGYCFASVKAFGTALGIDDLKTANSILQKLLKGNWLEPVKKKSKKKYAYEMIKHAENEKRIIQEFFDPTSFAIKEHSTKSARLGSFIPASMLNSNTLPPPPQKRPIDEDTTDDESQSSKRIKVSITAQNIIVPNLL